MKPDIAIVVVNMLTNLVGLRMMQTVSPMQKQTRIPL